MTTNVLMDEIWTDYGEAVNIFYNGNDVYIVGNGDFEDATVKRYINDYIDKHTELDVINLIYARETETINVTRISADADLDEDDF